MNRWLIHSLAASLALAAGTPSRAQESRPLSRASATAGPDGTPLGEGDYKELEAMQQAIEYYQDASKEYRGTVHHVVKQEYDKKRKAVQDKYGSQIKAVEAEEKQRRVDAIAQFESFLQKHPNDRRWTPDVIFRLAELYFEKANEEYLAAVDAAQKAADASRTEGGKTEVASASGGGAVTPDYQKTIDLYQRLIREFPDYRLVDGAYYLLGYCLGEMNKEAEARQAYLALVCTNQYKALDAPAPVESAKKGANAVFQDPYKQCKALNEASRFLPEAWTRIGENHFDYNELDLAIAAYGRVLQYKDSPYFDKALYKLAWSYYRADKYPEAIRRFDELVVFSDTAKSASGKEGSDLRQEAVQYLGISFAEKDWNGDQVDDVESGLQRIEAFYKSRGDERHLREIFQKLGDIYFDETEYLRAIEVYKRLQARWPLAVENPKVQDRIVLALERMRNFDQALREREVLARNYGKGTEWYRHNRDNKEALDHAADLAEQALVKYAVDHHKAAQSLKKLALATNPPNPKQIELAAKEYSLAADGYQKYLENYPNSKSTYEYTFFYAESLYYSTRFAESAAAYEKVRDSNLDNKYLEDAAFNAVKSYENLLEAEVKAGKLKYPPIPEAGKAAAPVQPLAMPEEVKRLELAYDAFIKQVPSSGRIATMAYKAAELPFRYLNFSDARPRMEDILGRYCKDDVALQAGKAIVTSYTLENNLDKLAEWTDRLTKNTCGSGKAQAEFLGDLKTTGSDVRFKIAERLFADKKYDEAAAAYIKLVDADPTNKSGNNDKALNNAAVCYENTNRFHAATKLYERIVNEFPKSEFVDEALFRTAVNYQKYFEFDKAVVSYQRLATDQRFKGSKHRTDSLFNAAVLLENDQAYGQAAKLFLQYAAEPNVKREDQAEAFFRSGLIYLKAKDAQKAAKVFRDYVKSYPSDAKRVLEANFRLAEVAELQKNRKDALAQYGKVAGMGASVPAASDGAEYPAHAAFILTEQELGGLEKMQIAGGKKFPDSYKLFKDEVSRLTAEYNKVVAYKRVTWTLAGFFRIGYVYELLSKALSAQLQAPCPPEIMKKYKQEGCDIYLEQLQKQIEPLVTSVDEEVVKRYRTTLEQAAKLGVSNEWTKLARQKANAYKPDEFPMTKDERIDFQLENPK